MLHIIYLTTFFPTSMVQYSTVLVYVHNILFLQSQCYTGDLDYCPSPVGLVFRCTIPTDYSIWFSCNPLSSSLPDVVELTVCLPLLVPLQLLEHTKTFWYRFQHPLLLWKLCFLQNCKLGTPVVRSRAIVLPLP